jgi:uncharacterized protein (UPF0333 family)
MNRLVSALLLTVGIVLIITGITASHSLGSDFSKIFTGAPTEKSIWLFLGGVLVTAIGAGGLLRGSREA